MHDTFVRLGEFWSAAVNSAATTDAIYSVVINPSNGPGDALIEDYTVGLDQLSAAGVEVR